MAHHLVLKYSSGYDYARKPRYPASGACHGDTSLGLSKLYSTKATAPQKVASDVPKSDPNSSSRLKARDAGQTKAKVKSKTSRSSKPQRKPRRYKVTKNRSRSRLYANKNADARPTQRRSATRTRKLQQAMDFSAKSSTLSNEQAPQQTRTEPRTAARPSTGTRSSSRARALRSSTRRRPSTANSRPPRNGNDFQTSARHARRQSGSAVPSRNAAVRLGPKQVQDLVSRLTAPCRKSLGAARQSSHTHTRPSTATRPNSPHGNRQTVQFGMNSFAVRQIPEPATDVDKLRVPPTTKQALWQLGNQQREGLAAVSVCLNSKQAMPRVLLLLAMSQCVFRSGRFARICRPLVKK